MAHVQGRRTARASKKVERSRVRQRKVRHITAGNDNVEVARLPAVPVRDRRWLHTDDFGSSPVQVSVAMKQLIALVVLCGVIGSAITAVVVSLTKIP